MINDFLNSMFVLAIDMGYYMTISLVLVAVLNIFMKREWIAKHLGGAGIWAIIKASIIGVPLPLCSCGVVPTGLYLKQMGASKASTVSFLISTPQTGADSIIATYGLMGPLFAIYRPIAAFISGVIGGISVSIFGKKEEVQIQKEVIQNEKIQLITRVKNSVKYAFGEFVEDISLHFIAGLLVAALISVLMPADFLLTIGLGSGILSMLIMIAVGAPMYICSTSSIPIAIMLMAKGLSPGAAFVFLFMGPFTNAASLIMISKKFGRKITIIYFASATFSALGFGLLLDYIADTFDFSIAYLLSQQNAANLSLLQIIIGSVFLLLVLYYAALKMKNFVKAKKAKSNAKNIDAAEYTIEGMTCKSCAVELETSFRDEDNVIDAKVDFSSSQLTIWGTIKHDEIQKIVEEHGYKLV